MKLPVMLIALFLFMSVWCDLDLKVAAKSTQAIPLHIHYISNNDQDMSAIAAYLQRCFTFTKQFAVATKAVEKLPTKKEVKLLKTNENVLLLVVLAPTKYGYEWHLYDTMSGTVLGAQRCKKQGEIERASAYAIADQLWPLLTSHEGFFSTKLAYCKKVADKQVKHIYIADFDGSYEQGIVETPTINIAPRWNHDRKRPLLFYSDYTPTNVRLNMVTKLVYCASRGDGCCQIYYFDKDTFKNITHNQGNNISPSLSADGKLVFFCSDFESKSPQLYVYNLVTELTQRLTNGGYAVSPRYSAKANQLAYAQRVDGIMQIFTYDVATKMHQQLTFDPLNKQEAAWSPCGNWLIYAAGKQGKSRIAMLNRHSKEQVYLTKIGQDCSYPDWSPRYNQFPVVFT
jgi:TolB protein